MSTSLRTPRSTALVAVLRLVIVAAAAGAIALAFAIGRDGGAGARRFVCPMHSEVHASEPGDCPICGMALEELDAGNHVAMPGDPAATGANDIALTALRSSGEAASLLRFSVAPARRNALVGEVYAPAIALADGTIRARLYRDELASLGDDELASFVPSAAPAAAISVRRMASAPDVHGALADVAFRAVSGSNPAAGAVGWIVLAQRTREMLVVRSASVIQSADGPYVLVFSARLGTLARRRIEIGKEYSGMTAVVSGLRDKEFVAMAHTFSFDAERRLQAAP